MNKTQLGPEYSNWAWDMCMYNCPPVCGVERNYRIYFISDSPQGYLMSDLVKKDINQSRNWRIELRAFDGGDQQINDKHLPLPYVRFFPDGKIRVALSKYHARYLTSDDRGTFKLISFLLADYNSWLIDVLESARIKYGDTIFNVRESIPHQTLSNLTKLLDQEGVYDRYLPTEK